MIKKNLRFQIVIIFIGVVLISLFLSFLITKKIFEHEMVIKKYSQVTLDAASLIAMADLENSVKAKGILKKYDINCIVLDQEVDPPFSISKEQTFRLFHTHSTKPLILSSRQEGTKVIVGVPNINEKGQALILRFDFYKIHNMVELLIFLALVLVLLIGSVFILSASRYIVEPLKQLSKASKEMAKGNLAVRLNHQRKDEFGELMDSFNYMASELEKAEKVREDFVSNVSHEIQSPLTSIKGFAKAIRDDVIPLENQKEYLDIIFQESQRLSRLGENLLRLAYLDSEHYPFQLETFRLDEQLRQTILSLEPQWKEKKLSIQLTMEPCEITADKDLFEQIWQNIINNAIKYSNIKGIIKVHIESSTQLIKVAIRDTGIGIKQEEIPFIFDRFYMVDKARKHSQGGNGLGLSIVKKIVTLHGGKIEVKSQKDQGSTFIIMVPVDPAAKECRVI